MVDMLIPLWWHANTNMVDMRIPLRLTCWYHYGWHADTIMVDMLIPSWLTCWYHYGWHANTIMVDMLIPIWLTCGYHYGWHADTIMVDMLTPLWLTCWYHYGWRTLSSNFLKLLWELFPRKNHFSYWEFIIDLLSFFSLTFYFTKKMFFSDLINVFFLNALHSLSNHGASFRWFCDFFFS